MVKYFRYCSIIFYIKAISTSEAIKLSGISAWILLRCEQEGPLISTECPPAIGTRAPKKTRGFIAPRQIVSEPSRLIACRSVSSAMHKPDLVKPSKGIEECVVVNSLGSVELVEESVVTNFKRNRFVALTCATGWREIKMLSLRAGIGF